MRRAAAPVAADDSGWAFPAATSGTGGLTLPRHCVAIAAKSVMQPSKTRQALKSCERDGGR